MWFIVVTDFMWSHSWNIGERFILANGYRRGIITFYFKIKNIKIKSCLSNLNWSATIACMCDCASIYLRAMIFEQPFANNFYDNLLFLSSYWLKTMERKKKERGKEDDVCIERKLSKSCYKMNVYISFLYFFWSDPFQLSLYAFYFLENWNSLVVRRLGLAYTDLVHLRLG